MDVDMIKSSASTALDLHHHHHHHDHHQHHHNLDVFTIMMQMEKPTTTTTTNTSPDHHQHQQQQQQQLICDPNYQTTNIVPLPSNNNSSSFLDINSFSDSHSPPSNSFMGMMNSTNSNPNPNPSSTIQEPIMMNTNGGILSGRVFKGNMGIGAMAASGGGSCPYEKRSGSMAAMREMIFQIAAMQPIHIDPEAIKPPKRRNVRISKDPQSVAARHRRERISERIRILQRLVPGGTKMDTASMLDEAIHYVKFLKKQVQTLEQAGAARPPGGGAGLFATPLGAAGSVANNANYSGFFKAANCLQPNVVSNSPMVESMRMLR